jgi:hypothetical protein
MLKKCSNALFIGVVVLAHCSFVLLGLKLNAQKMEWVSQTKTSGNNYTRGVTLLKDKVFTTGRQRGVSTFGYGSKTITSNHLGQHDIFIARYDKSSGDIEKLKIAGGPSYESGYRIANDGLNLYVYGRFQNSITIDGHSISAQGSNDIFIGKFDTSLTCLWLKSLGSTTSNTEGDFTYGAGYLYGSCGYTDKLYWQNDSISGGNSAIFSIDTSGQFIWVVGNEALSPNSRCMFRSLNYHEETQQICFGGGGAYEMNLGNINLKCYRSTSGDGIFGSISTTGVFQEAFAIGLNYAETIGSAKKIDSTTYLLGGSFAGRSVFFGDTFLIYSPFSGGVDASLKSNAFIALYNTKNGESKVHQVKSTRYSTIDEVIMDHNKVIRALGYYTDSMYSSKSYKSVGDGDCFLLTLDKSLNNPNEIVFGGDSTFNGGGGGDLGYELIKDEKNDLYFTSFFVGNFSKDGLTLEHNSNRTNYYGVNGRIIPEVKASQFWSNKSNICVDSSVVFHGPISSTSCAYEWSFTGGNPSSSTAQTVSVNYSKSGHYAVQLKIDCSGRRDSVQLDSIIEVMPCDVSLPSFGENWPGVYPNPAKNELFVTVGKVKGNFSLTIFDIRGKTVIAEDFYSEAQVKNIDISSLKSGIFLLRLKDRLSGLESTQRFVVSR